MMQPIRLGIIGAGLIWLRRHQPTLAALQEDFIPVAFADPSEQRRSQAAAAFPTATLVSGYQELLALPQVDAVVVLTPIVLNAPVASAALSAGKDVMMEKPIARSVAEAAQLLAQAKAAGRKLYVLEQMGYRHAEEILAATIASGEIGDLVLWERIEHFEGDREQGPMSYASTPWRKEANFPLGTLFDGGIHTIASLTKVYGRPQRVWAAGKKLRAEYGEFDQVAMLFHYANGSTGMLSHSSYLASQQNHYIVHGSAGTIVVEPQRLLLQKEGADAREIALPVEDSNDTMWRALSAAFHQGREPFYTGVRAMQDVLILEKVDQAIHQNQVMQLTTADMLGYQEKQHQA
jgi:scyllo-inositol 2-dehydrogenase (NADP+)